MMAQYHRLKSDLPEGAVLLFRLGDFYEMFFDDAKVCAEILNITLTQRGATPMCGIPHHAADNYIGKLLAAGRKVAMCEQTEEAVPGKLVNREVTQILSPGTHFDEKMLTAGRNNFLAALSREGKAFGLAVIDLTTGDFKATEMAGTAAVQAELERLKPSEIVHPAGDSSLAAAIAVSRAVVNEHEGWVFASDSAEYTLRDHFGVQSLDGFGLKNRPAATGAAGGALHYLVNTLRRDVAHLRQLNFYEDHDFLTLDATTLRNLEILEPLTRDAPSVACLYHAINQTVTPMGARRLRDWLTQPLANADAIHARQLAVQTWVEDGPRLEQLRNRLREVRDLERTLTRLSVGTGNGRDLLNLRFAIEQFPGLRSLIDEAHGEAAELELHDAEDVPLLTQLAAQLTELPEVVALIAGAIVDEPPLALREGGIIREKFSAELDELRGGASEGKAWIAQLQQRELESTRIPSLKVRFNNVFGYFIEVTKTHLDKVPAHYVRKQTVANAERYITDELKQMEDKVLGAQERSEKLEYELYLQVREAVLEHLRAIQTAAAALAQLDVLAGFAETARLHGYCRPHVGSEGTLEIREGRHPVLEQTLLDERFVPNRTELGGHSGEKQVALITGPNMAGKSTYIRQVALIALIAHTGSFVPAAEARVDLLDRIFTRIGASDNLARGQSTFMVEMSETANILHHATDRSLVILDEIGRGTSTFDGLSLAWSIVEHLHQQLGAKTLFATHYHELTELSQRLPRVFNLNVAVKEYNEQVVFLRQIIDGAADQSYGIQVARLAGVPQPVLTRAKEILANLEETDLTAAGGTQGTTNPKAERKKLRDLTPSPQLDLFE
ncbi:MAG: DNA mismatch repair protein MutS [Verrucomicrobia subdivision 3 bacterium]|nr:DNA mismatch repair protein MutS [Limisphaerales bacterium]